MIGQGRLRAAVVPGLARVAQRAGRFSLTGENLVHLSLPRATAGAITELLAALPSIEAKRPAFATRQALVDQAARELLLAPPPPVRPVTRPFG